MSVQDIACYAWTVAKVIYDMIETKKTVDASLLELQSRAHCLEQPLKVIQRPGKDMIIYSAALKKLIKVLESSRNLLIKIENINKTMRFVKSSAHQGAIISLNKLLDSCLQDLQTALLSDNSDASEKHVFETARTTVELMAMQQREKNDEVIYACVQCGVDFTESNNPHGGCKFHTGYPFAPSYTSTLQCCVVAASHDDWPFCHNGCVRGRHKKAHHTEYSYSNYFENIQAELRDAETWLEVEQEDFEDNDVPKRLVVGQLADKGPLYVAIFQNYYAVALESFLDVQITSEIPEHELITIRGSEHPPIIKYIDNSTNLLKWFSKAEWILEPTLGKNGKVDLAVAGVRGIVKSLSSTMPNISEIRFKRDPITEALIPGEITIVANDSSQAILPSPSFPLKEYKHDVISFPSYIRDGLHAINSKEFPTETTENLLIRLKRHGDIVANWDEKAHYSSKYDHFKQTFIIISTSAAATSSSQHFRSTFAINPHIHEVLSLLRDKKVTVDDTVRIIGALEKVYPPFPSDGSRPIQIVGVSGEWMDTSMKEWMPCEVEVEFDVNSVAVDLPFKLDAGESCRCTVKWKVDAKKNSSRWMHRAYAARLHPITVRVTFEEANQGTFSTQAAYGNGPDRGHYLLDHAKDIWTIILDREEQWSREHAGVKRSETKSVLFNIGGSMTSGIEASHLRKWAYEAKKAGQNEYKLQLPICNSILQIFAICDLDDPSGPKVAGLKFVIDYTSYENGKKVEGVWRLRDVWSDLNL